MIDYDKLKLAHELAEKYAKDNNETSSIVHHYYGASMQSYFEWQTYSHDYFKFRCIDDLITKLQELTQPKPKIEKDIDWWSIGQLFPSREALIEAQISYWESLKNEEQSTCSGDVSMTPPFEGKIKGFSDWQESCQHMFIGGICVKCGEDDLSLVLDSAIKDKCQHLCNGLSYATNTTNPPQYKCKKCGEFYR